MKKIISNKKLIIPLAIVLILSFILICFFTCPAYKTIRALKNGNSADATLQISKVDDIIQKKLFLLFIPSTMEDINNSYNVGELSFTNAEELYEIVVSSNITDVSKYHNDFKELASSKQSFDNALSAMNALDYPTAISHYKNVISADSLYDTAQQELQSATNKYKDKITDIFYEFVLNGKTNDARKIIDEAIAAVPDNSFIKMKDNLTSGVYDKICAILNKSSDWEIITKSRPGENTFCCHQIKLSKNNNNAFECYYVIRSLNSAVQSGSFSSISSLVSWYKLSGETISRLTYDEEKEIEYGGYSKSISWDYTMSKTEKFKRLVSLFT